jgi:F-type H+-transporting ATPase subunit a
MGEHQLWVTALLNKFLAAPANAILHWVGMTPENPAHPWSNFVAMEVLVALIIIVVFALLRPRLSVDRPGKLQHIFELIYGFLREQTDEAIGDRGRPYIAFFGTIFIFILFSNLIGIVPSFESPTMFVAVPLGCALATFAYYNVIGFQTQGIFRYLRHFVGPLPILAPLMVPIEIVSHLARPLSLTIRLFANMFAGEQVTLAFMSLLPLVLPLPFMGLHVFVSLLQAYIFALLTMVYVGEALPHHEHESS